MSIKLMSAAWEMDLPQSEKMVLLCLCDHANDEGVCWPSREGLARKCSVSVPTVKRAIKGLEDRGLISRSKRLHKTWICHVHLTGQNEPSMTVQSEPPDGSICSVRGVTVNPKPSRTIKEPSKTKRARECPDDFWPEPSPESKTAREMANWPRERLEREVERFVAHHQAKGNKYPNWQRAWTTWALSDFQKQGTGNGKQYGNSNQRTAELAAAKMQSFG